jgi:hypothetical protein
MAAAGNYLRRLTPMHCRFHLYEIKAAAPPAPRRRARAPGMRPGGRSLRATQRQVRFSPRSHDVGPLVTSLGFTVRLRTTDRRCSFAPAKVIKRGHVSVVSGVSLNAAIERKLAKAGVTSFQELLAMNEREVLRLPGIGVGTEQ